MPATLQAQLHGITQQAESIRSYELRPLPGSAFPAFTAGAHIDLHLANGLVRSYSLVNPQSERHRYVIAVSKDAASRGGSRYVHEQLRAGDVVVISPPRSNFPLEEKARHSTLIAGGVGVTPLYCMVQRLVELGASWELFYSARTRHSAAFAAELEALGERAGMPVRLNFDGEPGGSRLDVAAIVARAAPDTHLYCCGPAGILQAFESACAPRDPATVHVEYFSSSAAPATTGGFTVLLSRSNRSVFVREGKTILDALLEEGIDVPYSCAEGVCGTCETGVLSGVPDHRDLILTDAEHRANKTMMICCSGSRTAQLVLDR